MDNNSKIKEIRNAILTLSEHELIKSLFGDDAAAFVENEANNVFNILTMPCKSDNEKAGQQSKIDCHTQSWKSVAEQALKLGLSLNPHLKHCAIVPYGKIATLQDMRAGLIHILFTNNIASKIDLNAVCENDTFFLRQPLSKETLKDNFKFEKHLKTRGAIVGAYAMIFLKNGEVIADYMPLEELDKRKKSAKTQMIWNAWSIEMYEKTMLRNVCKDIPAFAKFQDVYNQIESQHIDFEKDLPRRKEQLAIAGYKQDSEDLVLGSEQWLSTFTDRIKAAKSKQDLQLISTEAKGKLIEKHFLEIKELGNQKYNELIADANA